jgi:hypothetical protein
VKSPKRKNLIKEIDRNNETRSIFIGENDILWYKRKIYLPNPSKFKIQVLIKIKLGFPNYRPCWISQSKLQYMEILLVERNEY